MTGTPVIVLSIIAVAAAMMLMVNVRVLREYQRGVVFRFGRLRPLRGPGLVTLIPLVDRMVRVDLRTVTLTIPPQEVITRDNVPARVNAVAYFRVVDPRLAITEVETYPVATSQIAQTTLRSVLGRADLDSLLAERDQLNKSLRQIIDEQTEPWGIKVTTVEIKDVEIPEAMQRAMARQAEAERERRAKIINAEGEFQASHRLHDASEILSRSPAALQLRYLQTLLSSVRTRTPPSSSRCLSTSSALSLTATCDSPPLRRHRTTPRTPTHHRRKPRSTAVAWYVGRLATSYGTRWTRDADPGPARDTAQTTLRSRRRSFTSLAHGCRTLGHVVMDQHTVVGPKAVELDGLAPTLADPLEPLALLLQHLRSSPCGALRSGGGTPARGVRAQRTGGPGRPPMARGTAAAVHPSAGAGARGRGGAGLGQRHAVAGDRHRGGDRAQRGFRVLPGGAGRTGGGGVGGVPALARPGVARRRGDRRCWHACWCQATC